MLARPERELRVAVRGDGDPTSWLQPARTVLAGIDPALPMADVSTLRGMVEDSLGAERLSLGLIATFAAAALLLASLGLYGVVANAVVGRRGEIGLRLAIGARADEVMRLVLGQGLRLVAAGVAVGLAASWYLSRFLGSLLYGVAPFDLLTYVGVAAVLLVVSALAAWIPARRATTVQPVEALRGR